MLVEGLTRVKRVKSVPGKEYLQFEVKELPVRGMELSESTAAAAVRALKNTFAEYAQISPRMPRELFEGIMSEENCAELFEKVVFNVVLKVEDKQALLETNGLLRRVKMLISMLESEIEIIETEIDIQEPGQGAGRQEPARILPPRAAPRHLQAARRGRQPAGRSRRLHREDQGAEPLRRNYRKTRRRGAETREDVLLLSGGGRYPRLSRHCA